MLLLVLVLVLLLVLPELPPQLRCFGHRQRRQENPAESATDPPGRTGCE
jgi:hypothetical protein